MARKTLRGWLYVWRPLLLTAGAAMLITWALWYGYAVHRHVREQLAEEQAMVARLTAMLSGPHKRADVSLGYVDTTGIGRMETILRPVGR